MPVTIDATVGGAAANSYVTLAQAETYLEARLNVGAWTAATTDLKNRALVEAQRTIGPLPWAGSRTTDAQALAWPRQYVANPDAPLPLTNIARENLLPTYVVYYDTDIIPQRVKDAQVELALEFLKSGTTDLAVADATADVIRKKVDVLETQYADPGKRTAQNLAKFSRVMSLLLPLFGPGAQSRVTRS
jgi:hypothetical protein